MIRLFEFQPQAKSAVRIQADELIEAPPEGWVWVDVESETLSTSTDLGRKLGIHAAVVEEATTTTSVPILEEHADFLSLALLGYRSGSGERLKTTRVEVFVGNHFLMTVHDGPLPTLGWLQERIEAGAELQDMSPMALLAHMVLAGSRRYLPLIQELENQIDGLEELAMVGNPRTITEVHVLRRDVTLLRRALGSQLRVAEGVVDSEHPTIDAQARYVFEKAVEHQTRIIESLEAARVMLGSALETHRGAVADQTNEIVRVLTVFSAVLLPLGLIAGMWGMNFSRVPGGDTSAGFWVMLGLMTILAVGIWIYFARRGFVGAPRVRELPKAVGLGLIHVGTAPIRVLAGGIESTIRYVARGGQEESEDE